MGHFLREKETEELLETQTRDIPMPDGTTKGHTGMNLMWNSLDYLIGNYGLELEWFVKLALQDAKAQKRTFAESFDNTVAYVRQEYAKAHEN